jgi:non-heme chloroperoxidase
MAVKDNQYHFAPGDLCFIKTNTMSLLTTTDGTTLFYKDWGTGKPVVFVHGAAMTSAFGEYIMLHLNSQGLRCIAYDQRGHGRSDDPGSGYNFDTLANDLHSLLETLGLQDVTLIGHSMGGGVIIRYQARYGHSGRVSKLCLIGTPDCLRKAADNPEGIEDSLFEEMLAATIAKDFPKWLDDNVNPFYLPATFDVSDGIIRWTIDMMRTTPMRTVVDCQRETFRADLRNDVRQISIPTLVIHGDLDASIPFRCGKAIADTIPGSVFKAYPGAPHGIMITHADQVNNDLLSFINEDK